MMGTWEAVIAVLGLTVITIVTRGFFFLTLRAVPNSGWMVSASATSANSIRVGRRSTNWVRYPWYSRSNCRPCW